MNLQSQNESMTGSSWNNINKTWETMSAGLPAAFTEKALFGLPAHTRIQTTFGGGLKHDCNQISTDSSESTPSNWISKVFHKPTVTEVHQSVWAKSSLWSFTVLHCGCLAGGATDRHFPCWKAASPASEVTDACIVTTATPAERLVTSGHTNPIWSLANHTIIS